MSRYSNFKIVDNDDEYYRFLRRKRGNIKNIRHYETPILYHPDVIERSNLRTTLHVWKVGDKFFKLANIFYNDPTLWWIISWYNGKPTEADVVEGDLLTIPLDLEIILETLGI